MTACGRCAWRAPEYGGDGKTADDRQQYATPVAAFAPQRPAVLDLAFYNGSKFPRRYRGGAFLAMHGGGADGTVVPGGHGGYNVMFVPFTGNRAGTPVVFADGFAGPGPSAKNVKTAAYRPVGVAVGAGRRALCRRFQQGPDLAHRLRRIAGLDGTAGPKAVGEKPAALTAFTAFRARLTADQRGKTRSVSKGRAGRPRGYAVTASGCRSSQCRLSSAGRASHS